MGARERERKREHRQRQEEEKEMATDHGSGAFSLCVSFPALSLAEMKGVQNGGEGGCAVKGFLPARPFFLRGKPDRSERAMGGEMSRRKFL